MGEAQHMQVLHRVSPAHLHGYRCEPAIKQAEEHFDRIHKQEENRSEKEI